MAQIIINFNHDGDVDLQADNLDGHSFDSMLQAMAGGIIGLIEGIIPEESHEAAFYAVIKHLSEGVTVHEATITNGGEVQQ